MKTIIYISILTVLMLTFLSSCRTIVEKTSVTRDTTYEYDTIYVELPKDTIRLESKLSILEYTDTNQISIRPYIAILDTIITYNKVVTRIRAKVKVPENTIDLTTEELQQKEFPVINTRMRERINEQTSTKIEPSFLDRLQENFFFLIGAFAVGFIAGLLLKRTIK